MKNATACIGLAGFALAAVFAITTATAQTALYPPGTDCAGLSGNSKTECANQAKNSANPDNSNNPAMSEPTQQNSSNSQTYSETNNYQSGTGMGVDPNNHENYRNYPGAGADCAEMVGNTKGDCADRATHSPSQDNSNNPDQLN